MERMLSVVAVIESPTPATWVNMLLARLAEHALLKLELVHLSDTAVPYQQAAASDLPGRLAAWLLMNIIDKPRFKDDPWALNALTNGLSSTLTTDENLNLDSSDVVLNLTRLPLPEGLTLPPETPVWSTDALTQDARVRAALLERAPLSWVHLWSQQYNHANTSLVASHCLPRQSFSLTDLRNAAWFCLPALIESRLNWLANGVDPMEMENSDQPTEQTQLEQDRASARQAAIEFQAQGFPSNLDNGLHRLWKVMQLWAKQTKSRLTNKLYYEQWQLAFAKHPNESQSLIKQLGNTSVEDYATINSPDRSWWADPHMYQHDNKRYVFFEEMPISRSYGHLSVARLTDDGQAVDVKTVMDDGKHLSYPFVFSHDGVDYMIPETASRRTVSLYRADQFPDQWSKVEDLMSNVDLADTTLIFHDERWWMFTNSMSHRSCDERDELRLFFSTSLQGPWQAHPLNPIVSGVDRARMAGSLLKIDGTLYRPSQYGAVRYGHGVNLHRIDRLDEHHYAEVPVSRTVPDSTGPWLGCHTLSHLNGVTVLDRVMWRRR